MLWMGIWVHPYAVWHVQEGMNFRKNGAWPSLYDVEVSWLRLQTPIDCIPHPYCMYLFIGETSFWYCGYSCLWNFKHLCTIHFAKAWKFPILANKSHDVKIETPTNHSSSRRDIVFCFVENYVGITQWFVISKKVSSLQITLKLCRNHDLNAFARMDILFIRLCPRPFNPNTVWKLRLRLSAFCMCYYVLVSYWWVR